MRTFKYGMHCALYASIGFSIVTMTSKASAAGTAILNQDSFLRGIDEPQWYKDNIPFLDIPDSAIQQTYYYRWSVYKRHIRYLDSANGYVVSEFMQTPSWSFAFGELNASAGHHIYEGRWLKNGRYLDDYQRFWLYGPGRTPTTGFDTGGINAAHQFSFWAADSYYNRYLVNMDKTYITGLLPELIRQYDEWNRNFDVGRGLYWQVPVWDAMEYTISSYQTNDPYHGGAGFRPSINAYQWADAKAISAVATLAGDSSIAADFNNRAASLKSNMQSQLWDPSRKFFFHMMHNNAAQDYPFPEGTLLDGREQIGFTPWAFNMPDSEYSVAWQQLMDPQGFYAPYGPLTAERRHRLFMYDSSNCCRWNGPSWPYSTSHTLMALANLLNNYTQSYVTKDNYFTLLRNYALSHYKNGQSYVAEAHHPDNDIWIYDSVNNSEHYNHSTFNDLVITGLIGLRPRADNIFEINPLVPSGWNYFALENVLYHGHLMTILWDRDGTHYGRGAGLRIFQDGEQIASSATLGHLQVPMDSPLEPKKSQLLHNLAATQSRSGYPSPIASYTNPHDNGWEAIDGNIWYEDIPDSRWTSYSSPNSKDWFGVDFGGPRAINEVRLYFYDDGGGVKAPTEYNVQYWDGSSWIDAPGQVKNSAIPRGRDLNIVRFAFVVTDRVRVIFTHALGSTSGVTEFEVWTNTQSPDNGVVFFQDAEYGGNASGIKGIGDYPVLPNDIPNDWMSSLKIPAGWTVEAYADGNFGGEVCTFTSSTTYVGSGCNDVISSFKIR